MKSSNIGGQAVLEGIMMKHEDEYAVAVRKPDGEILVKKDVYHGIIGWKPLTKIPFIRGIFNFIDSMVLGIRTLTYSAEFYEEEEDTKTKDVKKEDRETGKNQSEAAQKLMMAGTVLFSVAAAVGIFMVLPYFLSSLLRPFITSYMWRTVIEGFMRIGIFIVYVLLISRMEDIQRTFMYHGAEHKCINCIEKGRPLTVSNVMRSSKQHKRCGTSFMLFVMFVSVVLFFFIRVENPVYRVLLRIALIPVIAGISYEIIRLAGKSNNILVRIISAPGMWLQRLTTREPDESMAEVAIAAVEAVFDWKAYLYEAFGYEVDDSWLRDDEKSVEDTEFD